MTLLLATRSNAVRTYSRVASTAALYSLARLASRAMSVGSQTDRVLEDDVDADAGIKIVRVSDWS